MPRKAGKVTGSSGRPGWGPRLRPDQPGAREFEFGVQFPGKVGPRENWTPTRYAGVAGPVDFEAVFGRKAPVVLELGCGNGRYLIASAMSRPNRDHFGVDEIQRVIDFAVMRANRRCIRNARFDVCDSGAFLIGRVAVGSVAEIHVYHPQPYHDSSLKGRRFVNPGFYLAAFKALKPSGMLVLQTDNAAYWRYMLDTANVLFDATVLDGPWPDAPRGRTRREIIARRKNLEIRRMIARRKDGLTLDEASAAARSISKPDFDA